MEEQALFITASGHTVDGGWSYANAQVPAHYMYLVRAYLSAFPGQIAYMQKLPAVAVNEKNKRI